MWTNEKNKEDVAENGKREKYYELHTDRLLVKRKVTNHKHCIVIIKW